MVSKSIKVIYTEIVPAGKSGRAGSNEFMVFTKIRSFFKD
jgi:hypothetical protein